MAKRNLPTVSEVVKKGQSGGNSEEAAIFSLTLLFPGDASHNA